jgi:hypothetical protein
MSHGRADEHLEVKRTENLIQRRHNISDLKDQIIKYIIKCNSCHRNKIQRDKRYDKVTQLNTPDAPWESVTMNFIMKTDIKGSGMRSEIQQYIDYS